MQETRQIGSIAGFPISLSRLEARVELRIHGKQTYGSTVSDSPQGTIASLEHALGDMDAQLVEATENLDRLKTRIQDLEAQSHQPFEHQEKLEVAEKRQQEIVAALDLTRNQASTQVDAQPEAEAQDSTIKLTDGANDSRPTVAQPVPEISKAGEFPTTCSGITTPRGPLRRRADAVTTVHEVPFKQAQRSGIRMS